MALALATSDAGEVDGAEATGEIDTDATGELCTAAGNGLCEPPWAAASFPSTVVVVAGGGVAEDSLFADNTCSNGTAERV